MTWWLITRVLDFALSVLGLESLCWVFGQDTYSEY